MKRLVLGVAALAPVAAASTANARPTTEIIRDLSEAELAIVAGSSLWANELRDAAVRGAVGGATGTADGWWCSSYKDRYICD
jgi:hypothetical protein